MNCERRLFSEKEKFYYRIREAEHQRADPCDLSTVCPIIGTGARIQVVQKGEVFYVLYAVLLILSNGLAWCFFWEMC